MGRNDPRGRQADLDFDQPLVRCDRRTLLLQNHHTESGGNRSGGLSGGFAVQRRSATGESARGLAMSRQCCIPDERLCMLRECPTLKRY